MWRASDVVCEEKRRSLSRRRRRAVTCDLITLVSKVPAESELLGRPLSRVYVLSVENKPALSNGSRLPSLHNSSQSWSMPRGPRIQDHLNLVGEVRGILDVNLPEYMLRYMLLRTSLLVVT